MSSPNKPRYFMSLPTATVPPVGGVARVAAVILVALLPACLGTARAGVATDEQKNSFDSSALSSSRPGAATKPKLYQLRCWQNGRLLFEESRVALPADGAQYAIRMGGVDPHGRPIYVAETRNATCLIRAVAEDRFWPR